MDDSGKKKFIWVNKDKKPFDFFPQAAFVSVPIVINFKTKIIIRPPPDIPLNEKNHFPCNSMHVDMHMEAELCPAVVDVSMSCVLNYVYDTTGKLGSPVPVKTGKGLPGSMQCKKKKKEAPPLTVFLRLGKRLHLTS